jgi:hypothetical protein
MRVTLGGGMLATWVALAAAGSLATAPRPRPRLRRSARWAGMGHDGPCRVLAWGAVPAGYLPSPPPRPAALSSLATSSTRTTEGFPTPIGRGTVGRMEQRALIDIPPPFCQYAGGPCDQDFSNIEPMRGLFLYGSQPPSIAATIESAKAVLDGGDNQKWRGWRDLDIPGRIIFCQIGKAIRGAETVFADVTTLNFNVLFEIGYCIGLGVPVRPIRDTSYEIDRRDFKALGVLDTLGYIDFTNAGQLAAQVRDQSGAGLGRLAKKSYRDSPVYLLKGPIPTEGSVRIISTLKKSPLNFRVYDPEETPRVSFHLHWKEV